MTRTVPMSGQPVPTEYTLSKLPEDHPDWDIWRVKVVYRGEGRWAVTHRSKSLSTAGEWDHEPIPHPHIESWMGRHRFPLEEAIDRAVLALRLLQLPCRGCGPDSATGEDIDVHPDCPAHGAFLTGIIVPLEGKNPRSLTGQWAAYGLDDGDDADPWA